jgi:hypothetical protein
MKFVTLDPTTLLQQRFEHAPDECIHDIYDGEEYRQYTRPGGFLSSRIPANVSLALNTDGVALYKSSKFSFQS